MTRPRAPRSGVSPEAVLILLAAVVVVEAVWAVVLGVGVAS